MRSSSKRWRRASALVLALALAAAPAAAGAAKPRPNLRLGSTRAVAGAHVLVVGRHFPARARVRLYLGSLRLKTLRTNRRGRFRVRIRVPARAPRLYRLIAR